jgi:hypothetical protein
LTPAIVALGLGCGNDIGHCGHYSSCRVATILGYPTDKLTQAV